MFRPRTHHIVSLLFSLLLSVNSWAELGYPAQVKPIIEQRCMVCHGCYDAPCQLKLDAHAGLERGANKDKVYDGTRLVSANMTRLFEDANSEQQWRDKGFYPVHTDKDGETSVLQRMLELKQAHPLPAGEQLPDSFDLALNRDQQCPRRGEFDAFAEKYPLWGMPYALPGLTSEEHNILASWVEQGSPGVETARQTVAEVAAVERLEAFLNGSSDKHRLMSRYIYEHLFIANLYFTDAGSGERYYNMVRSKTPPGEPVEIIATRRPYDSPGKDPFFYRLQSVKFAILDKRHMPYALSAQRLARWRELFLQPNYEITELPSYKTNVASNPFVSFAQLPQKSRYKFMLDEAQFTLMGFIKGPVCRGQVALNVIDDHFWVVFMDPDRESGIDSPEFLKRESKNLRLPTGGGTVAALVQWLRYSRNQLNFLKEKSKYIQQATGQGGTKLALDLIWDGNAENDNASLTIFRHFDSASVVKGMVGRHPKTAWVIDYSLLERIHYLLVAGFDVYGSAGHQLETRLYMDFLRMEGEQNFLFFLPPETRLALRDLWYRGARDHVKKYVMTESIAYDRDTDILYTSEDPKVELLEMLKARQYGANTHGYDIGEPHLIDLQNLTGKSLSLLPPVSFLEVIDPQRSERMYSLIQNSGFKNNTQAFEEENRRLPKEDYLSVVRGFIGSYPNQFFQISEKELEKFVADIGALESEEDYRKLVSRYGVSRNASWFWKLSDNFYERYQELRPREAGLFDLNRYENR
ncbi:MAG: hypothetical protein ACI9NT_002476 [Bacteroidia bacterium]|jgi:hypothetical protein